MIEVLTDNHYEKMLDLFDDAKQNLKIISPFISKSIAEKLCESVRNSSVKCTFITRFYLEDMLNKANSNYYHERVCEEKSVNTDLL